MLSTIVLKDGCQEIRAQHQFMISMTMSHSKPSSSKLCTQKWLLTPHHLCLLLSLSLKQAAICFQDSGHYCLLHAIIQINSQSGGPTLQSHYKAKVDIHLHSTLPKPAQGAVLHTIIMCF
uniref:Uncharacterized protein n=1 Tax=Rhizophora mucronata TaxID=61149 RepID=A0A2P2MCV9_RHIMU